MNSMPCAFCHKRHRRGVACPVRDREEQARIKADEPPLSTGSAFMDYATRMRTEAPKPFVKTLGGKRALVPELLKYVPESFGAYYEPFLGGGALFFSLHFRERQQGRRHEWLLSDNNAELIDAWRVVRDEPGALIGRLKAMQKAHSAQREAHFLAMRAKAPISRLGRAARFIYLNKTAFNGLYRVNKKGQFNAPYGRYESPAICDEETLRRAHDEMRDMSLWAGPFDRMLTSPGFEPKADDLVYFDPPYIPVSATANFTSYTSGGFTLDDQAILHGMARALVRRGVHVVASNSDTPKTRELWSDFALHEVKARRAINCKGSKRGPVGELIMVGG